jgi:hypothetical protein
MRYLVLLAEGHPTGWNRMDDAGRQVVVRQHAEFDRAVRQRGRLLAAEALADAEAATTLRWGDGLRVMAPGPLASTPEHLAGLYLIDVEDLDTAAALCDLLPRTYSIELRPVIEIERSGSSP